MNNPGSTIFSIRAEVGASLPDKSNPTSIIHFMQTELPTNPSRSRALEQAHGQMETGRSSSNTPKITITENALKYIVDMRAQLGLPVKGLRVKVAPRSPLRAQFAMSFVPAEEPESPTDFIQSIEGIDIYVTAEGAPYLEGATIDFVFMLIGSELKVLAPLRKLDTPDGRIASKIEQVLAEQVNPSLAMHGGAAGLIDVVDGVAFLELTGGCQGCSMATATMRDGIEKSIRESVPEVKELRDVTEHANGMTPYFQ